MKNRKNNSKKGKGSIFSKLSIFQPNKYKFKKSCPLSLKGSPEIDYKNINFKSARLARVRGKDNKNLPPTANKTAKIINPIIIKSLKVFDIFFEEILLINFIRKQKIVKINTV